MVFKRYSGKISPLSVTLDKSREAETFRNFFKWECGPLYTVHSTDEKNPLYISKMQIGDLGEAIILGCNPERMHIYLNYSDPVVQEGFIRERFEKVREKLGISKSIMFYLSEDEVKNISGIEREYIELIDSLASTEQTSSLKGLVKKVIEG